MNFTLKILEKGRAEVRRYQTHSKRRFLNRIRTINWGSSGLKVYVRVSYGKHENDSGKRTTFYNDGWYESKEDLWLTLSAFLEAEEHWFKNQ